MNEQHEAACAQIQSIAHTGRAMGRALMVAISGMEALADEPDEETRQLIHDRFRNDIHAIIGEVLEP